MVMSLSAKALVVAFSCAAAPVADTVTVSGPGTSADTGGATSSTSGPGAASASGGPGASDKKDFGGGLGGFRDPLDAAGGGFGSYGSYGGYGGGGGGGAKDLYGGRDFYDRDLYGGYGGGGAGGGGGYGGYGGYGGFGDRFGAGGPGAAANEDDCARVEANGAPLAEALREAAENLGNATLTDAPESVRQLVDAFVAESHQKFMLANCPQAVLLAVLMKAYSNGTATAGVAVQKSVASGVGEFLALAPTLRAAYRIAPKWTGQPWETLLSSAQQRSGLVLFPTGEQQFQVEFISPQDWLILPRSRCKGRRDLGNLQGTPLEKCLAKCAAHPLCRSATFWHYQPGGFGFEQRCFLSSTCTPELATGEGSEYAVLFAKRSTRTEEQQVALRQTLLTPSGAPWAPRCGHQLLVTRRPGGSDVRLWLLGGVGVDAFDNASSASSTAAATPGVSTEASETTTTTSGKPRPTGTAARAAARARREARNGTAGTADSLGGATSSGGSSHSVIEAYLSRHVELSGELPPLRSLPYGRLGDVWYSDDLGMTWAQSAQKTAWGRRTFFGAASVRGGSAILVFGGVNSPASSDGLRGVYKNDVWWADLGQDSTATSSSLQWQKLPKAPWLARAGFQTVTLDPVGEEDEQVLLFGGRLADGSFTNDVWSANVRRSGKDVLKSQTDGDNWRQVTASADWAPRVDFAASSGGGSIWIFGGCRQDGHALADAWRSDDGGIKWRRLTAAAPWGPRIGPQATRLVGGELVVFGGYAYPNASFERVAPLAAEEPKDTWTAATWVSNDGGARWRPLNSSNVAWSPNTMHSALVAGPCNSDTDDTPASEAPWGCVYSVGGLTSEGYYDNNAHRIVSPGLLTSSLRTDPLDEAVVLEDTLAAKGSSDGASHAQQPGLDFLAQLPSGTLQAAMLTALMSLPLLILLCGRRKDKNNGGADSDGMAPDTRRAVALLAGGCVVCASVAAYAATTVVELSRELREFRSAEAPQCRVDADPTAVATLKEALGLGEFETLLRLASRESMLGGYGDYGGYGGGASKSFGRGFGDIGRDKFGYDNMYGGFGGAYGEDPLGGGAAESADTGKDAAAAQAARELAQLPTTQSLSCRSPRCDRNASACSSTAPRSLSTPYGCCSDYMMLMLVDVAEWLEQQQIPYFITYGTLLGALREGDMLPWTQDMDIVVDRSHWPKLQRGLEAAEFFGGRRYMFGVDQWEERVSRVCADWEGFAASIIGGPDGDRFSRGTEFHLDVYASDWWQVKDLHLVDCVEPLANATPLLIRGRNFSAPARPRACVEKLYGAEWRAPKKALSGVN